MRASHQTIPQTRSRLYHIRMPDTENTRMDVWVAAKTGFSSATMLSHAYKTRFGTSAVRNQVSSDLASSQGASIALSGDP